MTTLKQTKLNYPLRTEFMVGRNDEIERIHAAVSGKGSWLLYFSAEAGTGKTRLLEEAIAALSFQAGQENRCSGIIDMAQSEYHDHDSVQYEIARQLDPNNDFFKKYCEKREEVIKNVREGQEGVSLAHLSAQRDEQFSDDYKALANQARIVLVFDTTENIQLENELVKQLCEIETQSLMIKNWLIDRVANFENTVILMAGRPNQVVEQDILTGFKEKFWKVESYTLNQLSEEETKQYIQAILDRNPNQPVLNDPERKMLYSETNGNPIRLALALQFIFQNNFDAFSKSLIRHKGLDGLMMNYIQNDWPLYSDVMKHMFLARWGMDRGLMKELTGKSDNEIAGIFQEMSQIIFIKTSPAKDTLYLHDALYDSFDQFFGSDADTIQRYDKIAEYYEKKDREISSYLKKMESRVPWMYYLLRSQVEKALLYLERWEDEAIYVHADSVDMALNNIALRFIHRYIDKKVACKEPPHEKDNQFYNQSYADQVDLPALLRASALHWLDRFTEQGLNDRAVRVANKMLKADDSIFSFDKATDQLYQARLLTVLATNEIYVGSYEQVTKHLEEAQKILLEFQPRDDNERWWKNRTLGTINNFSGYFSRVNGLYAKAMSLYENALDAFPKGQFDYLRGQTLTNYAFLLSVVGRPRPALALINEAIEIWKKLDMRFRLGYSINTRSLILSSSEKPRAGKKEAEMALNIFEDLGGERGKVLTKLAIGLAERKIGNMWKRNWEEYPINEATQHFENAEKVLIEAKQIAEMLGERLLKWEANNELGSLYCDWAWLDRALKKPKEEILKRYQDSASYQTIALTFARGDQTKGEKLMPFQETDSLVDLAQLHGDLCFYHYEQENRQEYRSNLKQAHNYMETAEKSVPGDYQTLKHAGVNPIEHENGQPYWLLMGKTNLWLGVWGFRELEHRSLLSVDSNPKEIEAATRYLLRSVAYLKSYGEDTPPLERTLGYFIEYMQKANVQMSWLRKIMSKVEAELDAPKLLEFITKEVEPVLGK